MKIFNLAFLGAALLGLSNICVAGPTGVVERAIDKAGDTAVQVTNSVTGGVTSQTGKVKASGRVGGDVVNHASGDGSRSAVNVGGNIGVTAKKDIESTGQVGGNLTNVASGRNASATTVIGGNGAGR